MPTKQDVRLVIITGLSGAGKSQAVQSLEDLGYYCVDNLPPALVPKFAELCAHSKGKIKKAALVIDLRGREFFASLTEVLKELEQEGYPFEILFLEASNEVLVRRFKETRRRHPLAPGGSIFDGIIMERQKLEELKGRAHKIIDTSNLSPQMLKTQIKELFGTERGSNLAITIMSFGYKYGIPLDADLVIDVRFLPNPYYDEELRPHTGYNERVREYVLKNANANTFLSKFVDLLRFMIPFYIKEGKAHLVVAIGCTGGQHRSVVLTNKIAEEIAEYGMTVSAQHRDIPHTEGQA